MFELPGSAACYVTRTGDGEGEGPRIQCTPFGQAEDDGDDFKIMLADLVDIQSWMHLTFSANYSPDAQSRKSYLKIDQVAATGPYTQMRDRFAYYGAGFADETIANRKGFPGHYRQFYFTLGYMEQAQIELLEHQEKVLELETRGYFKFSGDFADAFRPQQAEKLGEQWPNIVEEREIAAPFCQSLAQKLVELPSFNSVSKGAF